MYMSYLDLSEPHFLHLYNGNRVTSSLRVSVRIKLDFVYKMPGFAANQLVALTTPTPALASYSDRGDDNLKMTHLPTVLLDRIHQVRGTVSDPPGENTVAVALL